MKKYKVGIFIDAFYPMIDGVISVVDNLAKHLSDKLDITIFTIKPSGNKEDTTVHPYKVVRCKSKSVIYLDYDLATPKLDRAFRKTLKESNLDLIYYHSPFTLASIATKYAKKHHIPCICHLHSQYKRDVQRATHNKVLTNIILKIFMKNFNRADLAIAVNEFTEKLYKEEYKLKVPVKVVYNATSMMPCSDTAKAREIVNQRFGLKDDEKLFLYVGRINKLKNIDLILDSLPLIEEKYQNFKMLFVGDGKNFDYFQQKASHLNLENKVIFAGKILDNELLTNIYCRSDLFLFPSQYDTDGIVKIEAASQHTPTVFIENTGASSAITDNENGFIAKNNPQDYAYKILLALTDEELYNRVCENAYSTLYRTWQESADEIYKIIIDTINGGKNE